MVQARKFRRLKILQKKRASKTQIECDTVEKGERMIYLSISFAIQIACGITCFFPLVFYSASFECVSIRLAQQQFQHVYRVCVCLRIEFTKLHHLHFNYTIKNAKVQFTLLMTSIRYFQQEKHTSGECCLLDKIFACIKMWRRCCFFILSFLVYSLAINSAANRFDPRNFA